MKALRKERKLGARAVHAAGRRARRRSRSRSSAPTARCCCAPGGCSVRAYAITAGRRRPHRRAQRHRHAHRADRALELRAAARPANASTSSAARGRAVVARRPRRELARPRAQLRAAPARARRRAAARAAPTSRRGSRTPTPGPVDARRVLVHVARGGHDDDRAAAGAARARRCRGRRGRRRASQRGIVRA